VDFTWFEKNKKTWGLVGFGVLAFIALVLTFFNPIDFVTGTSYPQRYAVFTGEYITGTVVSSAATAAYAAAMNGTSGSGGLAYAGNATSNPLTERGWGSVFSAANYVSINSSDDAKIVYTSNSTVKPVVRLNFFVPKGKTYTTLAGTLEGFANETAGHSYIVTGASNFHLGAAARVNITNATTLVSSATFVIEGMDYKNSARRETLVLTLANAGSGKGVVSSSYFKNLTSISTTNTDFAVQNFSLRTNYTNTNYSIETLLQFGGVTTASPYNYTTTFDAANNFSQPAKLVFTTTKCSDTNATGINITVTGRINGTTSSETLADVHCYAAANASTTVHYFYGVTGVNVSLNTSARSLNTSVNKINISIAVTAPESPKASFGHYNVTTSAANMTIWIWNFTSSAWQYINGSVTGGDQNDTLAIASGASSTVSGTTVEYMITSPKNSTLTLDWANLTAATYTSATNNRSLNLTNSSSQVSLNCTIIGTGTTGTYQYETVLFGTKSSYYTSNEFGTVTAMVCNATPSCGLVLSNYDGTSKIVNVTKSVTFTSFVANGVNNKYPPTANLTSEPVDLTYSDITAGSKKFYLKCSNTVTGYLEYSTDNASWTRESTVLGCSANATEYLLSSSALAAGYYKITVNHTYDAVIAAANVTAFVQGRHSTR